MQVRDLMSHGFDSIPLEATIRDAAYKMRDLDVGMLPVAQYGEIVGAVTDRDIIVRTIATGANPEITRVGDAMSTDIIVCLDSDDLGYAAHVMEKYQIRRLMVQNESGEFVGMLSLADVARHRGTEQFSIEVLEEVSRPRAPVNGNGL